MALDLTASGNAHVANITKKAEPIIQPLAGILVRGDELIHQIGEDALKQRVKVATAVMRGDDSKVRASMFDGLDADAQELIQRVLTGQVTKAGLKALTDEVERLRQAPQSGTTSSSSIPKEVSDAIDAALTAAEAAVSACTEAATEAEKVIPKSGFGKKDAIAAAKDKLGAATTAATKAKDEVVDANNVTPTTPLPATTT